VLALDERAEYWLGLADYDIETAEAMLKTKRYLYVGFMCHQAIEKGIKAIIARSCAEGEIPPRTHHLLKLADWADILRQLSPEQQAFIKELNPLNIEARYPEYREAIAAGLSAETCGGLLTGTEELLCWIKERL
jgi:HEPN domain-containing protein